MYTPTNVMPFSLVYCCEAILSLEIQLPSLHTTLVLEMTIKNNHKQHLQELEALDVKKLQAQ